QNKGNKELNNPLSPNYLNAKKYFEKALDVLNKNENITYRPELIECLTGSISKTESRYGEWLQNYHEMKKYLKKRFDINKQLTHQHCEKIYKGLNDLEFGIYTQKYTDLKERFSGANLFAIHAYCLKFIKILERKKYSKFNSIISKLYVRSSTFNRKKVYYLKKALKTDKNNLEGYYQLARHYEGIGEEKKALENWIKFSEVYFTKTKNKRFKKSKKGLLKILGHPYIFDPILVKRSERDLFKEFIITKIVYENLQRRELTSKPLYYLKTKEGYDYVVFRESQTKIGKADESRNLSAIINYLYNLKTNTKLFSQIKWANKKDIITNFEIGCLKKVINNLTNITRTTYLDNIVLDYDYGLKLRKKLNKTFLTNAEEFYKKCSFILDYLKQQPRSLCHADLHLDNILQMGGEFCVLDYGNAARASNVLDIAYLLEQEGLHLDSEQKKGLYYYFLNKSKIKIADKDETYDYHALYVNLLGVSTFNDERQKKYLHRADEIITKMCAYSKNKEPLYGLKEELKKFF
ncbi:MAG: phosphotransferase, partial [Nanoarchaeota archaeon]|nr:phosphotransferase [Nanoarchaeota archaeon]